MTWTEIFGWLALGGGLLFGALGTLLPGLPGALLVFAGALLNKWLLPDVLTWWTISIVGALALISWIVDLAGGILGARLGGATRAGLTGAAIGGMIGLFFGLPGLVIGPFCGAIIGDLISKRRDLKALLLSGSGAAAGFLLSLFVRLLILATMAIVLIADVLIS